MHRLILAHDAQERFFAAPHLAPQQFQHQAPGQAPALEIGMRADAADFAVSTGAQAPARHRNQTRAVEHAKILAQLNASCRKRAGNGQFGQAKRRVRVQRAEQDRLWSLVCGGHAPLPRHFDQDGFGRDAPSGGCKAGPAIAIQLFARGGIRRQGVEVRMLQVRKSNKGGKTGHIAAGPVRALGIGCMRPAQRMPNNIIKQRVHYASRRCPVDAD